VALSVTPLAAKEAVKEGKVQCGKGRARKGSPLSRFYITRALCKLSPGLRSLHPYATSGNPPHARPPPERGAPNRSNSRRSVTRHANGRMARAVATVPKIHRYGEDGDPFLNGNSFVTMRRVQTGLVPKPNRIICGNNPIARRLTQARKPQKGFGFSALGPVENRRYLQPNNRSVVGVLDPDVVDAAAVTSTAGG